MQKFKLFFIVLFVTLIISCDEDGPAINPFLHHQLVASIEQDIEYVNMYIITFKRPIPFDEYGGITLNIKTDKKINYTNLSEDRLHFRFSTNELEERFQTIELQTKDTTYKFEMYIQKDKPKLIEKFYSDKGLFLQIDYDKKIYIDGQNYFVATHNDFTNARAVLKSEFENDDKRIIIKLDDKDREQITLKLKRDHELMYNHFEVFSLEEILVKKTIFKYCDVEIKDIKSTKEIETIIFENGIYEKVKTEEPVIINFKKSFNLQNCENIKFLNTFFTDSFGITKNEYTCSKEEYGTGFNFMGTRLGIDILNNKHTVYLQFAENLGNSTLFDYSLFNFALRDLEIDIEKVKKNKELSIILTGNEILTYLEFIVHNEIIKKLKTDEHYEIRKNTKQEFELNANSKLSIRFYK